MTPEQIAKARAALAKHHRKASTVTVDRKAYFAAIWEKAELKRLLAEAMDRLHEAEVWQDHFHSENDAWHERDHQRHALPRSAAS